MTFFGLITNNKKIVIGYFDLDGNTKTIFETKDGLSPYPTSVCIDIDTGLIHHQTVSTLNKINVFSRALIPRYSYTKALKKLRMIVTSENIYKKGPSTKELMDAFGRKIKDI